MPLNIPIAFFTYLSARYAYISSCRDASYDRLSSASAFSLIVTIPLNILIAFLTYLSARYIPTRACYNARHSGLSSARAFSRTATTCFSVDTASLARLSISKHRPTQNPRVNESLFSILHMVLSSLRACGKYCR